MSTFLRKITIKDNVAISPMITASYEDVSEQSYLWQLEVYLSECRETTQQ